MAKDRVVCGLIRCGLPLDSYPAGRTIVWQSLLMVLVGASVSSAQDRDVWSDVCHQRIAALRAATESATFEGRNAVHDLAGLLDKLSAAGLKLEEDKLADAVQKVEEYIAKVLTLTAGEKLLLGEPPHPDLLLGASGVRACIASVRDGGPSPVLARIVVQPEGVMLPGLLKEKQLHATALNPDGLPLSVLLTWTSSNADAITVDEVGLVQAVADSGLARITVSAEGVESEPATVYVANVAPGVTLLTDANIIGGPTAADPDAEPSLDNPYNVVLAGVGAPMVGDLLANTEAQPVGGRVLAVTANDDGSVLVTLQVVPIDLLLVDFEFSDTVPVTGGPYEIPEEMLDYYDVVHDADKLIFTPKPDAVLEGTVGPSLATQATAPNQEKCESDDPDTWKGKVGPFCCELKVEGVLPGSLPLKIKPAPPIELAWDGVLQREYSNDELVKIEYRGRPSVTIQQQTEVETPFSGSVECKAVVNRKPLPLPGLLGILFGAELKFGVGFGASGKLTVASAKLDAQATVSAPFTLGVDCTTEECNVKTDIDLEFDSRFDLDVDPVVRFDPSMEGFLFAALDIGNTYIQSLQIESYTVKAGVTLGGSFAPKVLQIANEEYRSSYNLALGVSGKAGSKLTEFLENFGIELEVLSFSKSTTLAESPTGTFTIDRTAYAAGDTVQATIGLDPAKLSFTPLFPYNLKKIIIVQDNGFTTETLAELDLTESPAAGQSTFDIAFVAPDAVLGSDLHGFVVTKALPLDFLALELTKTEPAFALQAAAGTFVSVLRPTERTTTLYVRIRDAAGELPASAIPIQVVGPSGWNGGQPLLRTYPANASGLVLTTVVPAVSGDYRITATLPDGGPAEITVPLDAGQALGLAQNVRASFEVSSGLEARWDPLDGAYSYFTRVTDLTTGQGLSPSEWTTSTGAFLNVAIDPTHSNRLEVYAFSSDLTTSDSAIPTQLNASFNRIFLQPPRVTVTPESLTVRINGTAFFQAQVTGLSNPFVSWTYTCGQSGLYAGQNALSWIAPSVPGSCTITATSLTNSSIFASAQVSVVDCIFTPGALEAFAGTWVSADALEYGGLCPTCWDCCNWVADTGGKIRISVDSAAATWQLQVVDSDAFSLRDFEGRFYCSFPPLVGDGVSLYLDATTTPPLLRGRIVIESSYGDTRIICGDPCAFNVELVKVPE